MNMRFEWDEAKNQANIKKHHISFEQAVRVFSDPMYIEIFDFEHSVDEDRYVVLGKVREILFVVYTERKESVRIISARLATETERRMYYDQNIGC